MANTLPYRVDVATSDDQTFQFTLPVENADGTEFDFASYSFEYVIVDCGRAMHSLTEGAGITVTAPNVAFKLADPLRPGTYDHACRVRHTVSGDLVQIFDGKIIVSEGHFA